MLSLLNSTSTLNSFSNTKCAEVYCQTLEHFSIICTFCELKSFEFDDFLLHFKNVHVDNNEATTTPPPPSLQVTIKCEADAMTTEELGNVAEFDEQLQDIKVLTDSHHSTTNDDEIATDKFAANSLASDLDWKEEREKHNNDSESDSDAGNEDVKDEEYVPTVLKTPSKKVLPVKHKCEECGKSYKLAKFLEHHINKCHNKDKVFKCSRCDSEFSDDRSLTAHLQSVHDGFPCDQCNKTYKSKEALQLHVFNHTGVRNFICDVENCGKAFFNPKHLSCHKRIVHTLERNYVCEMCGYRTKAKPALIVHKRSHTGEKPFACKDCDRRFASQSLLGEHKAMHSTERPHKCEVCGASFSRSKALYHHKHLHLGIKKFLCKICGKAYAQAAGLSGHMRQHKSEQF